MLRSSKLLTSKNIFLLDFLDCFLYCWIIWCLLETMIIYIFISNSSFNMSSNIHKLMNENQNETENKTKMECSDINERKKRYLNKINFLASSHSCLWWNLVFWSMWCHYDIIKAKLIMLMSSKCTNTNQIWKTLMTINIQTLLQSQHIYTNWKTMHSLSKWRHNSIMAHIFLKIFW